jgi:3-phenylpropionate/trans-cinnamate dioxygenase ferredoxin component
MRNVPPGACLRIEPQHRAEGGLVEFLNHSTLRRPDARERFTEEDSRMATEFVTATKTSEIPAGSVTAVDVRGMRIAVANVGGTYYAFDDECTHEQCSLAEYGELAGTTLTCTCHGSEFDVRTGKVLAPPATVPVKVYPVQVAGDALQIEV